MALGTTENSIVPRSRRMRPPERPPPLAAMPGGRLCSADRSLPGAVDLPEALHPGSNAAMILQEAVGPGISRTTRSRAPYISDPQPCRLDHRGTAIYLANDKSQARGKALGTVHSMDLSRFLTAITAAAGVLTPLRR